MCTKGVLRPSRGASLWASIVVGLAYLPDVVNQVSMLLGSGDLAIVTHSVCFAAVASVALGIGLAKWGITSRRGGIGVCLVSILIHDVLDLMQSTNRQPWWPISDRAVGGGLKLIPMNSLQEVVLFSVAFIMFLATRALWRRRRPPIEKPPATWPPPTRSVVWTNRTLIALILFSACTTHYLRSVRERAYTQVRQSLSKGAYAAALAAADRAERWPSTAKPGRLDYARAEAYVGLGDRDRAEAAFAKGFKTDPHYFWGLADMAAFYASSDAPPQVRRFQVEPYIKKLKQEFADHDALERNLNRIERKLAQHQND